MKEFFRDITLGHGATRERCEFVALYLLQRHGVEPDRFPQPLRRGIPPHDGRLRCRCVKYPIMSLNCRPIMLRTCPISVLMEPHLYPMKSVEGHKMNNHPFSPKPLVLIQNGSILFIHLSHLILLSGREWKYRPPPRGIGSESYVMCSQQSTEGENRDCIRIAAFNSSLNRRRRQLLTNAAHISPLSLTP